MAVGTAENKYRGYSPIAILADNKALPNATVENATNMCYCGDGDKTKMKIVVYSEDAIALANDEYLEICVRGYTSDTIGSAVSLYTARGAQYADSEYCVGKLWGIGAGSTIPADTLLFEIPVPMELLKENSYDYFTVAPRTDADLESEGYTALVVMD